MMEFIDVRDSTEDEDRRTAMIAARVAAGQTVAFVIPMDLVKASRYALKLTTRYPIRLIGMREGPVKGTITIKVGPLIATEPEAE